MTFSLYGYERVTDRLKSAVQLFQFWCYRSGFWRREGKGERSPFLFLSFLSFWARLLKKKRPLNEPYSSLAANSPTKRNDTKVETKRASCFFSRTLHFTTPSMRQRRRGGERGRGTPICQRPYQFITSAIKRGCVRHGWPGCLCLTRERGNEAILPAALPPIVLCRM